MPDGTPVRELIDGVNTRDAVTHIDERGELAEIFNPAWGFSDYPLVYAYMTIVRPGRIKGWVLHRKQDDRLFGCTGALRIVLYDGRADSPTSGRINEFFIGERRRAMVTIPSGVWHAVQNVGGWEALFVNLPSRPYDHLDPDKYRLPIDTDEIPFRNWDRPGW